MLGGENGVAKFSGPLPKTGQRDGFAPATDRGRRLPESGPYTHARGIMAPMRSIRVVMMGAVVVSCLSCGGAEVSVADDWHSASDQPLETAGVTAAVVDDVVPAHETAAAVDEDVQPAPAEPLRDMPKPIERGKRIGATGPHVWIMPNASSKGLALGNIRLGTSIALRDEEPKPGTGCGKAWYPVQPRGWVCLGPRTTIDLSDEYYRALRDVGPKRGALYPYRYAYSRGAPMYSRVPTPDEWEQGEMKYGPVGSYADLGQWAKGHEELIEEGRNIEATDPVPWFFEGGERRVSGGTRSSLVLVWKTIPNGSMLAYARAFSMYDRVWLVTPDLTVVPADRVQFIKEHRFHGVPIEGDVELPIGWNRGHDPQPLYRQLDNGSFEPMADRLAGKQWVMISGTKRGTAKDPFYELRRRPGVFIRGKHSTISWQRKALPRAIKPGQKWLDAGIASGTLTAYRGLKPIYATLFSPGLGGAPVPGRDHSKYATTQTGYFRFEWKEAVATMSNEPGEPTVLWFSDVPHIQYIRAPLAMHVAYWHEDFSNRKSAECVNVSAMDGRWLFGWTDPPLPRDWGAVRPGGGNGDSTAIMINGY